MATKKEKKVITLFNNYNGYDFADEKAALEECNPGITITDEMVWDSIRDTEDEDYSMCKHYLKDVFGDSRVIVNGTAGTWHGRHEAAKMFIDIESALAACVRDCDYFKVEQLSNREINVTSTHHDGTNYFSIKIVTEKGGRLFDNWDYGVHTKLADLNEWQILEKIWNDSHYSKRAAMVW